MFLREDDFRTLIFETIIKTGIKERFNTSDKFWEQSDARDTTLKKDQIAKFVKKIPLHLCSTFNRIILFIVNLFVKV